MRREAVNVSYGVFIMKHPLSCASFVIVNETGAPSHTIMHFAPISIAQS